MNGIRERMHGVERAVTGENGMIKLGGSVRCASHLRSHRVSGSTILSASRRMPETLRRSRMLGRRDKVGKERRVLICPGRLGRWGRRDNFGIFLFLFYNLQ